MLLAPTLNGFSTILLVDDHLGFRKAVADTLALTQGTYLEASNGREALTTCEDSVNGVDLVVMDLEMPEMDGIEATRQIRIRFPETRIVILTQHDEPGLKALCREAGACAYVLKDDLLELVALLNNLPPARISRI